MLTAFVTKNKVDWDQGLCYVLFSCRELPIEELGFSPYELTFSRDNNGLCLLFIPPGGKQEKIKHHDIY